MPLINNPDFRNRHAALQADWEKDSRLLGQLTSEQRPVLRAFYIFDVLLRTENFAAAEATTWRGRSCRKGGGAHTIRVP